MDPAIASIIVSVLTAIGLVLVAVVQRQTHNLVNSRMTELLALAKKSSKAEGVEEERARESPAPQQVEVVNDDPVHVTIKKPPASK